MRDILIIGVLMFGMMGCAVPPSGVRPGQSVPGQSIETICDNQRGVLVYLTRTASGAIATLSTVPGGCPITQPEKK